MGRVSRRGVQISACGADSGFRGGVREFRVVGQHFESEGLIREKLSDVYRSWSVGCV